VVLAVQWDSTISAGKTVSDSVTIDYKQIAADYHAQFVPFAIDRDGGIGKHTQQFIKQIATFAHDNQTILVMRGMIEGMIGEINIAVERGIELAIIVVALVQIVGEWVQLFDPIVLVLSLFASYNNYCKWIMVRWQWESIGMILFRQVESQLIMRNSSSTNHCTTEGILRIHCECWH
jgi:hypothetical protein